MPVYVSASLTCMFFLSSGLVSISHMYVFLVLSKVTRFHDLPHSVQHGYTSDASSMHLFIDMYIHLRHSRTLAHTHTHIHTHTHTHIHPARHTFIFVCMSICIQTLIFYYFPGVHAALLYTTPTARHMHSWCVKKAEVA